MRHLNNQRENHVGFSESSLIQFYRIITITLYLPRLGVGRYGLPFSSFFFI